MMLGGDARREPPPALAALADSHKDAPDTQREHRRRSATLWLNSASLLPTLMSKEDLPDHADRILRHRVKGRHGLRIRLKGTLRHNQICELS